MKKAAIEAALLRFERCKNEYKKYLVACEITSQKFSSPDKLMATGIFFDAEIEAWDNFLVNSSRFFNMLAAGVNSHGASKGWFDRIIRGRKEDVVMRYLKHARNADDHTIQIPMDLPLIVSSEEGEDYSARVRKTGEHSYDLEIFDFSKVTLKFPGVVAVAVKDRGIKYDPPKEYNGKPIAANPETLMRIGLDRMTEIVQAAEEHIQD